MSLDQGHSFGVKEFPEFEQVNIPCSDALCITLLRKAKDKSGVSDADKDDLHCAACSSPDHYKVMTRILRKDLRCGCGADSINKAKPGLVYKVPYQRCGKSEKINTITYPALLQRKANGLFSYSLPSGEFLTRQGNRFTIPGNPVTLQHQNYFFLKDKVLIMELVVLDECGVVMDRAVGNGIINSFIKGDGEEKYIDRVRAFCWGFVSGAEFTAGVSNRDYGTMWGILEGQLPGDGSAALNPISTWLVNSLEEAQTKANELIAAGEEGGVLKSLSPDFVWKDEDPCNFQFKLKAQADAEFEIVSAYYGEKGKKYEKVLGGLTVKSSDGLIVTDVGGGFTDEQRKLGVDYWNSLAGSICTVRFNGVTTVEGVKALDHPRFIELRLDKSSADTLEYCVDALLGRVKK